MLAEIRNALAIFRPLTTSETVAIRLHGQPARRRRAGFEQAWSAATLL
jgi:hypothetical protein